MLVILEGLEGVGKTTVAEAISRSLTIPVYRAFRQGRRAHAGTGSQLDAMLKDFGVPHNTHVEDLYAVDLLTTVGGSVILDRSMPSAVAYGIADGILDSDLAYKMFRYWASRLESRIDVRYAYMKCDRHVASIRTKRGVIDQERLQVLEKNLDHCYDEMATTFQSAVIDTSTHGVSGALAEISKLLGREIRE